MIFYCIIGLIISAMGIIVCICSLNSGDSKPTVSLALFLWVFSLVGNGAIFIKLITEAEEAAVPELECASVNEYGAAVDYNVKT